MAHESAQHEADKEGSVRPRTDAAEGRTADDKAGLPTSARVAKLLQLQRTHGNAFVQRYIRRSQRASTGGDADELSERIESARAHGAPLEPNVQQQLEGGLAADLGDVRVHTDASANGLAEDFRATAFTTGQDIFFGNGAYQPDTDTGRELIAHEAVHAVQQGSGNSAGSEGLTVSHPSDPSELAAETIAHGLMQGERPQAVSRSVQRAAEDANETPSPPRQQASRSDLPPLPASPPPPVPASPAPAPPPPAPVAPAPPQPVLMAAPPIPPAPVTLAPTPVVQMPAPTTDLSQVAGAASQAQSLLAGLAAPVQLAEGAASGAQVLITALQQAADQGAADIVSAANQAIAAVHAATSEQSAVLEQTEAEQTQALQAGFTSGQTEIQGMVMVQSMALQASAAGEQERVTDWSGQATAQAEQEVSTRQQQLQALGEEQADQARGAGDQAVGRATSALTSAGSQAEQSASTGGGGRDEAEQEGHKEVANKLSTDTAEQIESATGDAQAQFGTHASDAASAVEDSAESIATTVGSHLPTLQGSIAETATGASEQLASSATSGAAALTEHGQQAVDQLASTSARLAGELGGQSQQSRDELHAGAQQAIDAISSQAAQTVSEGRASLADQAASLTTAALDQATATDAAAQVQTAVGGAFSTAAGEIEATQTGLTNQLASVAGTAVAALTDLPTQALNQLTPAVAGVMGEVVNATSQATSAMTQSVDAVRAAAGGAMATTTAALDGIVSTGGEALSGAVGQVRSGLDQGASETETRTIDATSGLQQRIQEGSRRVDASVQSEGGADIQRSWLGDAVDWVSDQLGSLWNLLKDPAFWIGLGVTLILFPFLGPGAVVVGGFVGGAVGGIENNIRQGKAWYDPHNIVVGAAIGTLAGAAFAFGGGFIVGLGLEGGAALAGTMALSSGVGILVNLATGQRWDKGLLANLFLGWLFHKVGGGEAKGEAPPERTPESESLPESKGQPAKAGNEEPAQQPGEQGCFVAGTSVDTPVGSVAIEDVVAGMHVVGWDFDATGPIQAPVSVVMRREVSTVLDLHVGRTIITCSTEHPFWVTGTGWLTAGELTAGDSLQTRDGSPVTLDAVDQRRGQFAVFNMMVDGPNNYFVGTAGVLVHNKAMRWFLVDRIASIEQRAADVVARAEALPRSAAGREALIEQARGLQSEATALAERTRGAADEAALDPERPNVESLESRLNNFEEGLEIPEIPNGVSELERGVDDLLKRAEDNLPEELPTRWDIIGRIRLLKQEIADLRALVDEGLADESVVREIDRLRGALRDLDGELTTMEPAARAPDAWQQRLDSATWDPHRYKHMQARSEAQARDMTTPTDVNPDPDSQYLPDVNNEALELEALRNGEVIRGDPTDPNGTVHVKYDANRTIGYDGGEPVSTMRAEISGRTYHGHPRAKF